ncbi:hypothetical protein [Vineibacter terrae]|uniref:tetratricopeptide repeat protein n=1 Tax=Vineibacter terrae TaxID=2586908 RepID=UPI002E3687FB|nr:hypothetical protein [Vineibacter terrae]HEX2890408.1 hypothetical protein [Vineibacter terrae]
MPQTGSGGRWLDAVAWLRDSQLALWAGRLWRPVGWAASVAWRPLRTGTAIAWSALASTIAALPDGIDQLRKLVAGLALVGGIVVGTWIIVDLSSNEPLTFDDIYVHGTLVGQVPKGDYLAQRVGAYFDQVTASIAQFREIDTSASKPDAELPKLEIPGAQVSVQAVVQIVRRFLGFRERRIGGDVFVSEHPLEPQPPNASLVDAPACPDGGRAVYVVIRLSVNRADLAEPVEVRVCRDKAPDGKIDSSALDAHTFEALLQRAALRAYERVNPCGSATYYFANWYRRFLDGRLVDADSRRASQMVSTCLAAGGADVAAYSYVMIGRIRQFFYQQPEEAIGYFESAENVHRKAHAPWRRYLHDHDWWWIRFPNDFYAHWGAALMDAQEPTKALEKYVLQVKYSPGSVLGYIGVGNALAEMARRTTPPDGGLLKAAREVYCYAALENRFDTEVRHAMADFLEKNQTSVEGCPDKSGREDRSDARKYALVQRQKTVDLMPTEPRYGLALGRSLRAGGKHLDALAAFNQVLTFSGQEAWDAYAELATTYAALDQEANVTATYRRAYGALSRAAAQRPFDAEVRYHAALALLRLGEFGKAERYAVEASILDPSLGDAQLALACARKHLRAGKKASLDEPLQACVADPGPAAAKMP